MQINARHFWKTTFRTSQGNAETNSKQVGQNYYCLLECFSQFCAISVSLFNKNNNVAELASLFCSPSRRNELQSQQSSLDDFPRCCVPNRSLKCSSSWVFVWKSLTDTSSCNQCKIVVFFSSVHNLPRVTNLNWWTRSFSFHHTSRYVKDVEWGSISWTWSPPAALSR